MKKIGILSLQGDFQRHGEMFSSLGAEVQYVRSPSAVAGVDAFVIPGGESTTIGKLMKRYEILESIKARIEGGMPVFGTCAGLILLSRQNDDPLQFRVDVLHVEVKRNGYGRQTESFEADINIPLLPESSFRGVFIRAPIVTHTGDDVDVLARFEGNPVLLQQGSILAASFHPELTDDSRIHEYFLSFA